MSIIFNKFTFVFILFFQFSFSQNIIEKWKTKDDEIGKEKSISKVNFKNQFQKSISKINIKNQY